MWRKLFGIGDLDPAAFTRLVATMGIDSGRFSDPAVDPAQMTIRDGGGMLDLHNVYNKFLDLPRRQRDGFIRQVILAPLPDVPETWDEVKQMLLPVLRDGAYLTFAKLQLALMGSPDANANELAYRELAPGVFQTLVIDTPDKMLGVSADRLAEWGVRFEDALEIAQARLRRISLDAFEELLPGLWVAPWQDSYAAARLMLPDVLQRVCTNPLVAVPNRDNLLLADPRQDGAFEKLVIALQKIAEGPNAYCVTRRIYELEDKTLRVYTPPADSRLLADYERMLVEEQALNYEREQELHQQLGSESFYAKMMAFESSSGEIITRAAWTKGVDSYLPPAQALHLLELADDVDEITRMWEVPWDVAVASGLLTPTQAPLPRWKAGEFPTPQWLAEHAKLLDQAAN